jgi:hypothetical protein
MVTEQRKTPSGQTGGIPKTHHSHHDEATSSIADRAEFFAQTLHGIYIVVAEIKPANGEQRFRRRFYASLESAQRHVDRSRMNGREAHLYIGQLHIVDGDGSE